MTRLLPIHTFQQLYPQKIIETLALKLFRREPAITRFDLHFTSYHSSSDGFVLPTGSGLPSPFGKVHPGHGKLTWLRVLSIQHNKARYSHSLSLRLRPAKNLDKLNTQTRWLILQQAPRHPRLCKHNRDSESLQAHGFRYYFTALNGLLFTFPSRYLSSIDLEEYLALGVSSPGFPRPTHVSKYSRINTQSVCQFLYTGLLPSLVGLSSLLLLKNTSLLTLLSE